MGSALPVSLDLLVCFSSPVVSLVFADLVLERGLTVLFLVEVEGLELIVVVAAVELVGAL